MLRIAICDDEKMDRKILSAMIERYTADYHIECEKAEYDSADGFLEIFKEGSCIESPDILFLDIFMSGMSGIELAKKLRADGVKSEIVFITSSNEYAADAYEVDAFSYLRKPLEEEKFDELMDNIMGRFNRTRSIEVNCDRMTEKIYISDILYIETSGRQLVIHAAGRDYTVYMSIAGILKMLPQADFVQVSRFEAVSLCHIKMMNEKEVLLDEGTTVALSPKLADHITERYDEYRRRR